MPKTTKSAQPSFNAYCVKCKAKTDAPGTASKDKRGRSRLEGQCPKCQTKIFRYVKQAE